MQLLGLLIYEVDIMWKSPGYSNYRDLGLYEYYSTSYVPMSYHDSELNQTDINIEIITRTLHRVKLLKEELADEFGVSKTEIE